MMNRVKICALLFSLLVLLLGCGNEMNSKELIERYETPSVNEILNEIDMSLERGTSETNQSGASHENRKRLVI